MIQDPPPPVTTGATATRFDGVVFPEAPRWHDGRLWFSDIHGRHVWRLATDGDASTAGPKMIGAVMASIPMPSGIGFLPDGDALVVGMHDKIVWRLRPGRAPSVHADLTAFDGEFLNDMVVDDRGFAYVGCRTHRSPGVPPTSDLLVRVRPDGTADVAADDVIGPNGAAITADGATLILAETHAHRISAFDRRRDGELVNRRVFAELDRDLLDGRKVFPDGLCLDEAGAVWIGTGFGGRFLRVLEGGEATERIAPADGRWAIACVLGGADRRTLFMMSASTEVANLRPLTDSERTDDDEHRAWARTLSQGFVETIDVEVPGAGRP